MFSISASLCSTGNALIPRSGSTQEILVLLQEQVEGHASADIHGSPEPTVTPTATTHHQKHCHEPEVPHTEGRAQIPGPEAHISGVPTLSYKARRKAPRPGPGWLGSAPVRPVKEKRGEERCGVTSRIRCWGGKKLWRDARKPSEVSEMTDETQKKVWKGLEELRCPPESSVRQPVSQSLSATGALCAK